MVFQQISEFGVCFSEKNNENIWKIDASSKTNRIIFVYNDIDMSLEQKLCENMWVIVVGLRFPPVFPQLMKSLCFPICLTYSFLVPLVCTLYAITCLQLHSLWICFLIFNTSASQRGVIIRMMVSWQSQCIFFVFIPYSHLVNDSNCLVIWCYVNGCLDDHLQTIVSFTGDVNFEWIICVWNETFILFTWL